MSRPTPARGLLAACAVLVATACTTAPPVSNSLDVKDGFWSGKALSFTVHGGLVSDVVLTEHSCQDSGKTCSDTIGGPMTGSSTLVPFKMFLPGGNLYGKFNTSSTASGSWTAANGTCCKVVVVWLATWQKPWVAPPDAGSSDAGAVDGGSVKPGSANWGGASTGTAHPGPALGLKIPKQPDGLGDAQLQALTVVDTRRAAAGSPMLAQAATIANAAQAHADFYGKYAAKYQQAGLSPHSEDADFGDGFTGEQFSERMSFAGFQGNGTQWPASEVMAFHGEPEAAVDAWLETVYHRLPLLDPTTTAIGYGKSTQGAACDVIDTAARVATPADPIVVWPWPGMTGVPASWSGNEGPQPPKPPKGFPSGPVVTAQFPSGVDVSAHTLKDASGKEIPHVWLDSKTDPNLNGDKAATALYANAPLVKGATYTVRLQYGGNVLEWRFTVAN